MAVPGSVPQFTPLKFCAVGVSPTPTWPRAMLAIDCVTVLARPAADRARDTALCWAAIVLPHPAGSAKYQAARTADGSAESHVPGAAAG